MRNKPGMDSLSFDDLYNNLRVFENDVKGSTASSSNLQNVAFVSENTSSTNEVSTAHGVSNTSGHYSKHEQTSSYSLLAMAMISMRIKKFYKKTGRKLQFDAKEPVGFDKTKVECYNCHKTGHFARECRTKEDNRRRDGWNSGNKDGNRTGKKEESKAMVTVDGECVDWTAHSEDDENFAFMASNSSGSDTQRATYDARCRIKAYTQGLKKVKHNLVAPQQSQLAQKEKDDLEVIVDKWNHSSKNLGKIINDHMPASDKFGLGYGDYRYSGNLSYENEISKSVFVCNKSDSENRPLHTRLVKPSEMQAVPPPMTGNYLPSGPDVEIDDSQYTYGPRESQPSDLNIRTEPTELVSEPIVNESQMEVQPKVWSDAPIIEEYESDSDDENVTVQTKRLDTPSFANKQVKTPRENVKNQSTHSQKPKVNNKELRHGSTERGCFVCGSFGHLIRDCDYHVKLAKQVELHKQNMTKGNGTGVRKPTWNNVQRVNKQNQFVPLAVQTRTGINPVNTAKASGTNYVSTARRKINKQTVLTSTALKVNTVKPIVNDVRPANVFHKTHSPSSRPFKRTTVLKTNFSKQKVYTVKVKEVSTVGEKWDTAVKSSAGCKWRTPGYNNNILSKYNGGSSLRIYSTFKDPLGRLKPKQAWVPKRAQTGNKAYLLTFQDFKGGACCLWRTLIEAARTMLADSFLPNTFWAEAVSTACYVLNRVLVTKPQNKTPYELITGKIPIISYIRPFGCHVTILNTIDHLGKFDGKSDEGFLVGYSLNSKAFRVYNLETKRVEENLHITFLENKPNVAGKGPNWLFDLDYLTDSMNYQPVRSENQAYKNAGPKEANHSAGTQDNIDAENSEMEAESAQDYFVLPIWSSYTSTVKSSEAKNEGEKPNKSNEKPVDQEDQAFLEELERLKSQEKEANDAAEALRKEFAQDTEDLLLQAGAARASSTNTVNTASTPVSTASPSGGLSYTDLTNSDQDDSQIPALEDSYDNPNDGIFTNASYDDEGAVADFTNLETIVNVSPIPTSRIHSVHPSTQILGDPKSTVQTRSKVNKSSGAHAFVSYIQKQRRNNHKDFQHCLFACFLSQNEPKKISEALEDENLPHGKKAIRTKWVYRNKKDERGVVVRNKARIEAIRIFLAFASYMGFIVYQMDVKSAFLYGTIDEEVYVSQPPGFVDPKCPKKVYKVVKALYGLHQAPKAWYATLSTFLLKSGYRRGTIDKTLFIKKDKNDIMLVQVYVDDIIFGSTKRSWCDEFEALMKSKFQMSSMGELTFFLGLQVKQKEDGIFISQDKYVAEILKKFDFVSVKTAG
ncbi:putative ribonuclease H-like domain-containing protein [Tanacetum coccineum]